MVRAEFVTIPELAKALGISRVAVYKRVKKGQIPATKVGRTYIIRDRDIAGILKGEMTAADRKRIDNAVKRTVRQYGIVLKRLSVE